jgi:hypothetical protein
MSGDNILGMGTGYKGMREGYKGIRVLGIGDRCISDRLYNLNHLSQSSDIFHFY